QGQEGEASSTYCGALSGLAPSRDLAAGICQVLPLRVGQGGELRIEALERVVENFRDGRMRKPLVIGWNDEPRRMRRAGGRQQVFIRAHVVFPARPLRQITSRELPVLRGIVNARKQPLFLFLPRDVQEQFDDRRAVPP